MSSLPPGVLCDATLDGLTIELPPPWTALLRMIRLGIYVPCGLLGFAVGGVGCALISTSLTPALRLVPVLLPLLGFGGMFASLFFLADPVNTAILRRLSPVQLVVNRSALRITHRKQTRHIPLSTVVGLDTNRATLVLQDGQRIALAPNQPDFVAQWLVPQIRDWLAKHLPKQGDTQDIPAALKPLQRPLSK